MTPQQPTTERSALASPRGDTVLMPEAMEVFEVTKRRSRRRGTKAYRERIIRHILDVHAGIYGAEVCQVCGEIGTYRSLAGAYKRHYKFRAEFIGRHGHSAAEVEKAMRGRHRFCEVCRTRFVPKTDNRVGYHRVRDTCLHEIGARDPNRPVLDAIRRLTRRRYIDLECPTDEKLRAFDRMVTEMRFELDEGWAGPPKPGLKGTREERWRMVVEKTSQRHGIEYLTEE